MNFEGEPLATDQRGDGFARIVGPAVDIGAVEWAEGYEPVVDVDFPTGEIGLFDAVETAWSVAGAPLEASIFFYADPDDTFNGNEIAVGGTVLDGGAQGGLEFAGC